MRNRLTHFLVVTATLVAMLAATGSSDAPAATAPGADSQLHPSTRQRALAPRIAQLLEQVHLNRTPIDDAVSARVLDRFLDVLDGQHSYFTAADIKSFEPLRDQFDDMIHSGRIGPAFDIFALYQQRYRERVRFAIDSLAAEPDWTVDESYQYDRKKQPWAQGAADLDRLWRKRVKFDALSLMLAGKTWAEATPLLRKRYERVLTRIDQIKADEAFELLMNSYAAVCDPHTNYFSPVNTEENRIQMSLSYEGIGASLSLTDDLVTITELLSGGPAAAAGTLKPNDRIVAVGQGANGSLTEVIGWRLEDVVQLIRGKGGTTVRLQVLPAGAAAGTSEHVVSLVRGRITNEKLAAKKEVREVKVGERTLRIGVITVPGFYQDVAQRNANNPDYRGTTHDVRRLITELRAGGPIDALLLDLRGDGGGFLPEAQSLTGLFIDRGPVVQLRGADGRVEVLDDPESGVFYDGPLAVLVDRTSASASEIFAGAMQDYHRGVIIGQTTFGKGTVQNQYPLDRWLSQSTDGQINVTIGKFYRVTGESTQFRGVVPDIELPSFVPVDEVGESSLDYALPWDRISSSRFAALTPPPGLLARLKSKEAERARTDVNYSWLLQNVKALADARQEDSISLNLATRQRERAALDAARLARENTRRSASGLPPIKSLDELKADEQPDVQLLHAVATAADLALAGSDSKLTADAGSVRIAAR
jgi:carboxyl-terminal processing protease